MSETRESRRRRVNLRWIEGEFATCRLAADAAMPEWASGGPFVSVTRTAEELSVVCRRESVPEGVKAETGWGCLKLEGPFAFSEVGILLSVLEPLSGAGIPIFAVSTFDTDYVLIKQEFHGRATEILMGAGHEFIG